NFVSVIVTDDGTPPLSATQTFSAFVFASNQPPVLAAVSDQVLHAMMTLLLTNSATDPDLPPQTLSFSLDAGAPTGAAVDSVSGILSWTPTDLQLGVAPITVRVTDDGTPPQSAATSFDVTVVARPTLSATLTSSNTVILSWSTIPTRVYRLQSKDDIEATVWNDLSSELTASGDSLTQE